LIASIDAGICSYAWAAFDAEYRKEKILEREANIFSSL